MKTRWPPYTHSPHPPGLSFPNSGAIGSIHENGRPPSSSPSPPLCLLAPPSHLALQTDRQEELGNAHDGQSSHGCQRVPRTASGLTNCCSHRINGDKRNKTMSSPPRESGPLTGPCHCVATRREIWPDGLFGMLALELLHHPGPSAFLHFPDHSHTEEGAGGGNSYRAVPG